MINFPLILLLLHNIITDELYENPKQCTGVACCEYRINAGDSSILCQDFYNESTTKYQANKQKCNLF